LHLATGTSDSNDAATALRDLYLGKVAFFDITGSLRSVGSGLESLPSSSGLEFREPLRPRMPQLDKLDQELSKVAEQIPKGETLLVFGASANAVSQSLTDRGIPHTRRAPEHGVQGGSVYMKRARKGWPTYLDELPGLDLFVLKNRH